MVRKNCQKCVCNIMLCGFFKNGNVYLLNSNVVKVVKEVKHSVPLFAQLIQVLFVRKTGWIAFGYVMALSGKMISKKLWQ